MAAASRAAASNAPTLGNRFDQFQAIQYSTSTYLTVKSFDLRNGSRTPAGRHEMNAIEDNARKVVFGVLAPAALVLVSAIETLARLVFAAGAYVYIATHGGEDAEGAQKATNEYLYSLSFSGAMFSGENVANCVMTVYQNIKQWNEPVRLNYDELLPGLREWNNDDLNLIDGFYVDSNPRYAERPVRAAGEQAPADPAAGGQKPKAEASAPANEAAAV